MSLLVGILSWECSTRQRKSWKRFIQRITAIGRRHRTYEIQVSGMRGGDPVRDMVYVDVSQATSSQFTRKYMARVFRAPYASPKASTRKPIQRSNCVEREKLLQY